MKSFKKYFLENTTIKFIYPSIKPIIHQILFFKKIKLNNYI